MGDRDDLVDDLDEQEDEELEDDESLEDESDEESDEESESADDAEEGDKSKKDSAEARIRKLQSERDKAIAELNKLKKAAPTSNQPKDAQRKQRDPELERLVASVRETARAGVYGAEPRFKEYGITAEQIAGESPEEMQESAKALTKLINRVETRVRNKVLREHGFSPPPKDGGAEPRRNFATMSQEEFDKLVKQHSGL